MPIEVPVRERVCLQLVRKMEGMTKDENNGVEFQFVTREELDHSKKFMGNAVSVLDMDEIYTYQTCYLLCTLKVGIEFWFKGKIGETASTNLGAVLAEIKRVLLSDVNLIEEGTGLPLTENIRIVQVDYDIEGPFEEVVSGFVQFDVIYRTNKENPYELM